MEGGRAKQAIFSHGKFARSRATGPPSPSADKAASAFMTSAFIERSVARIRLLKLIGAISSQSWIHQPVNRFFGQGKGSRGNHAGKS